MKRKLFAFIALFSILLTACTEDYQILDSVDGLVLTADRSARTVGDPITFTVKDNEGNDLTAEAVIYVQGNPIDGAVFTTEAVGNYEVVAKYSGLDTEPITVRFHDGSETNFTKRLLIEDYTGTWCGYCPRVAYGIELVMNQTENVVPVAIHRASLNPNHPTYDPYTYDSTELENMINIPGYPKGLLNRMTQWNYPEPNNINQAIALTQGENPKLGVAMTSSVSGNTINLDVNVKFGKNFDGLKLVVYVLENGLVHKQYNYTTYYNGEDIIQNFEHNHVLRGCLTSLLGDAISSADTRTGETFTRSFTAQIPATVENAANLEFVAFMVDAQGHALNVRRNHPGEAQEFEEF